MPSTTYKIALYAVIVCVFIVLVAPDIDLPDSTVLSVKNGLHLVVAAIDMSMISMLLTVVALASLLERNAIVSRFDAPTNSSLCTFLC